MGRLIDRAEDVRPFRFRFEHDRAKALSPEESLDLIHQPDPGDPGDHPERSQRPVLPKGGGEQQRRQLRRGRAAAGRRPGRAGLEGPGGRVLRFTQAEWSAFLDGAKGGEFDESPPWQLTTTRRSRRPRVLLAAGRLSARRRGDRRGDAQGRPVGPGLRGMERPGAGSKRQTCLDNPSRVLQRCPAYDLALPSRSAAELPPPRPVGRSRESTMPGAAMTRHPHPPSPSISRENTGSAPHRALRAVVRPTSGLARRAASRRCACSRRSCSPRPRPSARPRRPSPRPPRPR